MAPTQRIPAVVAAEDGGATWAALEWRLTPRWARERSSKYATFNARAEDLERKPAFRASFQDRRCLIVASTFYEWARDGTGRAARRRPHAIGLKDGSPLALAGVWDQWIDRDTGEVVDSSAVVTTEPNALMGRIHDRMPVVVGPEEREVWLYGSAAEARHVMRPYDPEAMEAVEVSTCVSDARNKGPSACARSPIDTL